MVRFIGLRLLAVVPTLIIVTFLVYGLVLLIPGDPAITLAGPDATAADVEALRESLGLNQPFIIQYLNWASAALRGDLGYSLFSNLPVLDTIMRALPVTLSLALVAIVIAIALSIPLAFLSARNPGSFIDRIATVGSSVGIALPNFWLALLLVLAFAIAIPILPATGYVKFEESPAMWLSHLILPGLALGLAAAGESTRQLRGSLIEVLQQDYVRTARAKGMTESITLGKHALKNAAVPLVTVTGLQAIYLLGGAVIVEQVFGLPGLGQIVVTAVTTRDIPMIQGVVMVAVVIAIIVNLAVDITIAYLNPKVRTR